MLEATQDVEWRKNLDSWKSRRRKMSETAIRRQEELRQLEVEDQPQTTNSQQKKIKTFSEMVEQRAHRGRALSLCLFSNPLESSDWVFETSKPRKNGARSQDPLSGESAESSTMNSEDDNESYNAKHEDEEDKNNYNCVNNLQPQLTNGHHNSIENSASNSSISKSSELSEFEASQGCMSSKERSSSAGYIDSGLESLSSSHRTGDIPDSGSDFSHDSGSSLDCDSPRVSALITTGIELLEEFSSKDEDLFSANSNCQKQVPPKEPVAASPTNNVVQSTKPPPAKSSGEVNKVKTKKITKKEAGINKQAAVKPPSQCNGKENTSSSKALSSASKSIESENEMFVDDFEELARLKSAKNSAEQKNGDSKVDGVSDVPFVDPANHPLNVIYKSDTKESPTGSLTSSTMNSPSQSSTNTFSLIAEVPVEKITEEMERLILEQLEEEEKAKEIALAEEKKSFADDKSDLVVPLKHTEPPKEKPPPPPSSSPPSAPSRESALKRVNSTKRIIKEIHKRRSDFLGIDKTGEGNINSEVCVPPPPVLEDLLRAEREQDRLRRQMLASKVPNQPFPEEEDEISKKEQEIIESLEIEERLRQEQEAPPNPVDIQVIEEERINKLKEECKQIEEERLIAEEQKARLEEARLLQRREEYIRKQEVDGDKDTAISSLSSSIDASSTKPVLSTLEEGNSLLSKNGDGQTNTAIVSPPDVSSKTKELPPATLPKPPLKKKEAIRKERERLRQEQEALQREREEHRLKIQKEQEQLKKTTAPSSHVSPRVDPPIPAKPTQQPRLTNSSLISPLQPPEGSYNGSSLSSRETNGIQTPGAPSAASRPSRSAVARTKARVQQKVPCVRKQAELSSEGSRYNQNHWLIQEAEMRRIAEQKERQRSGSGPVDARFIAANQVTYHQPPIYSEEYRQTVSQRPSNLPLAQTPNVNSSNYAVPAQLYSPDQHWTFPTQSSVPSRNANPSSVAPTMGMDTAVYPRPADHSVSGPIKPVKGMPLEKQEQMLSVSGRKRCSHCGEELGRGAAMIIESLQLYYHIHCFQCCVCQAQLGNGSCGTDVRVRNNKLHCHNCYSNDEAGLKFSQV